MFMRYNGGGIGHTTTQAQLGNDADEMGVDKDQEMNIDIEPQHGDQDLLEELHRVSNTLGTGEMTKERDEVEAADYDHDKEDSSDSGSDLEDDSCSDSEDTHDLGPEDGEDADFVDTDTGYGTL
jgi:hypothetical protein